MAITDLKESWDKYVQMFVEKPPIFGYEDEEILPAINKAIETGNPMPGADEVIKKELGIIENGVDAEKDIIV
jgi:hypothetical protein